MGHQFAEKDFDVAVSGEVSEFVVTTSLNPLTWDAIGYLDISLEVQRTTGAQLKITRRYTSRSVSKTVTGPSDANFEQVMRACLEDMQMQMASDEELARLLGQRVE
jgi:hypothetical protein